MPSSLGDAHLDGCRILVVEDTYFIADDIAAALIGVGAAVVGPAPNGEVALSMLASERVDAAVLDINLHGVTVFPVADALETRGTPFIFATGYVAASIPPAYRHIRLMEKPFDRAALVEALRELIGTA